VNKNIKVTLNGKTVYGYQGQRILDLCAECGGGQCLFLGVELGNIRPDLRKFFIIRSRSRGCHLLLFALKVVKILPDAVIFLH
jgi:hypothetical protein